MQKNTLVKIVLKTMTMKTGLKTWNNDILGANKFGKFS